MNNFSFAIMPPENDVLSYALLKKDAVFKKIPREQIKYYVDSAMFAGNEAAKLFKGQDINELCCRYGIKIKKNNKSASFYNLKLRAQFTCVNGDNTIELFDESLKELAKSISQFSELDLMDCQALVEKIHVAHEFFHFWENVSSKPVNEILPQILIFQIGKLKHISSVIQTSEIAAHAFCKELLDLSVMPNVFDYYYHLNEANISEEQLNSHFQRLVSEWEKIKQL